MAGDLSPEEFDRALRRTAEKLSSYFRRVGDLPVFPRVVPGAVAGELPPGPPPTGEPLDEILDDYERLIEANVTHWNHPGFMAYFSISGSGPGILGEALAAGLNVNAMKWATSPAATELEVRTCDWLRQMVGLPESFDGHINDTASTGTLLALAAARHRAFPEARESGAPAGRTLSIYTSEQSHSSVDKAAMVLGFGLANVRHIAVDDEFRMQPQALEAAISEDLESGTKPLAIVATLGTTSTTSVDPIAEIAEIAGRTNVWLHVDAAYGGSAALCPELARLFDGWERADSIVVNPHKWLFTPVDCSVLFVRDLEEWRGAFALVPDYLRSADSAEVDLMDLGFQLGRRFRALKLWMVIRAFGVDGLAERIRDHCELARMLADRIDASTDFERVAPVPFSTVCFRARFPGAGEEQADRLNAELLDRINAAGPFFLSATRLDGRFVLRVAIGNIRTERRHVEELWRIVEREVRAAGPHAGEGAS